MLVKTNELIDAVKAANSDSQSFTDDLIERIIKHIERLNSPTKDAELYLLEEFFPEIPREELAFFVSNDSLTDVMKAEKLKYYINYFCNIEHSVDADFSDPSRITIFSHDIDLSDVNGDFVGSVDAVVNVDITNYTLKIWLPLTGTTLYDDIGLDGILETFDYWYNEKGSNIYSFVHNKLLSDIGLDTLKEYIVNDRPSSSKLEIGDYIMINSMDGEPQYDGSKGLVTSIDDIGGYHGTWGGLALYDIDDYDVLQKGLGNEINKNREALLNYFSVDGLQVSEAGRDIYITADISLLKVSFNDDGSIKVEYFEEMGAGDDDLLIMEEFDDFVAFCDWYSSQSFLFTDDLGVGILDLKSNDASVTLDSNQSMF